VLQKFRLWLFVFGHQKQISTQGIAFRFLGSMLTVFGEPFDISSRFQLPMAIPANSSFKFFVQFAGNGMVHLETENVRFPAIKAACGVPHILPAFLDAPSSQNGVRIAHTLASGVT
jgi:hypothetical protein